MKFNLKDLKLKDALDLAVQIELEAKARYEEFNRQIGSQASGDAGDFFVRMSLNEKKHADDLRKKRVELFGDTPSTISLEELYHLQEIEAPTFDQAESFMSVKKALLVARECELKAYEFFDKAQSLVSDKEVKALFIELRGEELEHQRMIEELMNKMGKGDEFPTVDKDEVDEPNGL